MAKTQEDWFLRGGERPHADAKNERIDGSTCQGFTCQGFTCQNCGQSWPAEVGEICPMCGASLTGGASTAEYCGADGDGADCVNRAARYPMHEENARISFDVTLAREKTVEQTYTVTVRARDEDDALREARKLLLDSDIDPDEWDWETDEDTAELGEPRVADVEEVF